MAAGLAALLVAPALLAGGCGTDKPSGPGNHAPVIRQVVAVPPAVPRGGQAQFTVLVDDAENDSLTYAWSATAGTFKRTDQVRVAWTAPSAGMNVQVKVVVSDGTAADSGAVTVGVGSGVIDVESVPPGAYILINGKNTGYVTPWRFNDMAATSYNLQMSSSYFYYSPSDLLVTLSDGDTARAQFVLPAVGTEIADTGPDPVDEIGGLCYGPENLGVLYTTRVGSETALRSAGLTPWRTGTNGVILQTGVHLEERLSLRVPTAGSVEVAFVREGEIRIGRFHDPNHDGLITSLDTTATLRTPSIWTYAPSFSRDGTLLAYGVAPSTQPNDTDVILVGDYDTTTVSYVRRVTGIYGNAVSFGPERQVAFESGGEIYTATVDVSGTTTRVTTTGGHARAPAFSPDGRFVAYIDDRGYVELLVPAIQVTTRLRSGVTSMGVAWASDGRELVFGDNSTPGQARLVLLVNLPTR